ncbi:MAG: HEPN domain-containing protein [Verrucomicrobiota bacterium]
MNALVKEWVAKAEGDCTTALREYRARKSPNHDAVCFHAQQCIEKYLKAVLQKHGIPFRKIHDLEILLQSCLEIFPLWQAMQDDMELLTQYAIHFRYPGESADKVEAKSAIDAMMRCRGEIREVLGF